MDIIVKSQKELDAIPVDTKDTIIIEFGTDESPACITKCYMHPVKVCGNSSVRAYKNSSVHACDNSSVWAYDNSSVVAYENSSVEAYRNSTIVAYRNSTIVAYDNSLVWAYGNSSVEAYGNVRAYDNSSVRAYGNSSVRAYGNSSVEAYGNVRVIDFLQGSMISIHGNAHVVYIPKNIEEFMDFYGIEHDETTATFFKAVHKKEINDIFEYISNYDSDFKYEIGKKVISDEFNSDLNVTCGKGIHISHKNWALDFGKKWSDLAILELKVNIKDIVLPIGSDGKVRVPEAEVIREVPLEECGIHRKIIKKKLENQK